MGILDKMFRSQREIAKEEVNKVPWNDLETIETLDTLTNESHTQPVAILKHSTRCGISRMVLKQFETDYNLGKEEIKLYFLDLLTYREISNRIASKFNVPHESPQLIVIKNGKVAYHASHQEIEVEKLKNNL